MKLSAAKKATLLAALKRDVRPGDRRQVLREILRWEAPWSYRDGVLKVGEAGTDAVWYCRGHFVQLGCGRYAKRFTGAGRGFDSLTLFKAWADAQPAVR